MQNIPMIMNDLSALRDVYLPTLDSNPYDDYNRMCKATARDASILESGEVTKFHEQILNVLRYKSKYQMLIDTMDIGPGLTKYKYKSNQDVPAPDLTSSFENGTNVNVVGSETTVNLYGLSYDTHIDKITLDAGNRASGQTYKYSPSVEQNHINELTNALVQYWNNWVFWGSAYDGFATDLGVKGICNYSGITNITPSNTTLTTAGDIQTIVSEMRNGLIAAKYDPPFEVHMSPLVYNKAKTLYNATTRETDMDLINKDTDYSIQMNGSRVMMNPFIIEGTAETTSTGAILVMKKTPENFIAQSYPMGLYPKVNTGLGWDAKLLVYGGVVLKRPTAVVYEASLTTA